jgi:protein-tyrosine phosphatase
MKRTNSMIDLTLDYHAHILPGCDHGSDSVETSRKQLAMAAAAGVRTVCATPHFYPHKESIPSFLQRREASARLLRENLTADALQLQLGAEVLICDGMERLDGLSRLCRGETNELLLEMPFYQWSESIWDTLYALCERRDIEIVLAHAERYPPEAIEQLIRDNVALQLNSECLTRPLHRKRYLTWIKNGSVKYLGSDIHMLGNGYRDFEKCRRLLKKEV